MQNLLAIGILVVYGLVAFIAGQEYGKPKTQYKTAQCASYIDLPRLPTKGKGKPSPVILGAISERFLAKN